MLGLVSNFGTELALATATLLAATVVALMSMLKARRGGSPGLVATSKALFVGALGVTVAATALPRRLAIEADGDLVLRLGGGGLSDWEGLMSQPLSLASVVLAGNVLLYAAIAATFVVGWNRLRHYAIPLCATVSIVIETLQYLALGRVAALDDVVLNVAGAILGWVIGSAFHHARAGVRAGHI